jgi:thioredoxin reductase (NADPH)
MVNMRKQAEKFGAKIVEADAVSLETAGSGFKIRDTRGEALNGRAVVVATGAITRWLGVPGEERLIGRGVSTCAPCDAAFFKGKRVIVVGGGDAAMEEALVLTKFATEVTVVHRRGEFRASKIMQDKVSNHPKIKVRWNTIVTEVLGEKKVTGVKLASTGISPSAPSPNSSLWLASGAVGEGWGEVFPVDGVFVAIGHAPASELFKGKLELDEKGFVVRGKNEKYKTMTNIPGVFVAGDVHDWHYKQAITAAGYGCEAALEVEKWLEEQGK